MVKFILLFSLCASSYLFNSKIDVVSKKENLLLLHKHGGRCTGSANCTACSSCQYCKHCNSGGSCGVCGGGVNKPANYTTTTYSSVTSSINGKGTKTLTSDNFIPFTIYKVNSSSLNVRSGPGTDFKIIDTLEKERK